MAEFTIELWKWQESHRVLADWMHVIVLLSLVVVWVACKTARDIYKALMR